MANTNTLSSVLDRMVAQGLLLLRQNAIMPRLVNRAYESLAGNRGSTIEISVPAALSAAAVSPSNTAPDNAGVTPTLVSIPLDQWYEASFFMTDKDLQDVRDGLLPGQAQAAVKALANNIDSAILALYKQVYGYAGVAGTTPFKTGLDEFVSARKVLADQLCPTDSRSVVLDTAAEANALLLRPVQDASYRASAQGIVEGQIGRILGADWYMDQNVPTHTAGTASGATTDAAGYAAGVKTVTLASAGSGTILVGDVITFAGQTQTYTVTSGDADVSGGGTISFEPGLVSALSAAAKAITVKGSHAVNLAFHRDAFAFVSRPFSGADPANLGNFSFMTDPVSGLSLRLEITRQHRRTNWAFDVLYGVKAVRPELACRIAG